MSKKEMKALQDEKIDDVAGGWITNNRWEYKCNICGKTFNIHDAIPMSRNVHICNNCLKEKQRALGDKAFAAWLANPNAAEGFNLG